mmetsp:Transcript_23719/g.38069  ORF Transcript_23719/g.38069 Transcript_23719/m.38069 type:complete len:385 (+) Transcript_23719:295-1449(+)
MKGLNSVALRSVPPIYTMNMDSGEEGSPMTTDAPGSNTFTPNPSLHEPDGPMKPGVVQALTSLTRTTSSRKIYFDEQHDDSMTKSQSKDISDTSTKDVDRLPKLREEPCKESQDDHPRDVNRSSNGVPSLMEEVEMAPAARSSSPHDRKTAKQSNAKKEDAGAPLCGRRMLQGEVLATSAKEDPLFKAGFQTITVTLGHPLVQLHRWVVAGLVHWELDGVKQMANALMYFMSESELQLLTVDGPVPTPQKKKNSPFSIVLEPIKRIRYIRENRGEIRPSQLKIRILEDIVEAKENSQHMMPPCLTWPFAMSWWNKCTKKRKLDDDGTSSDSKEASVDFTKCYGCGGKIKQEVFMFLDHSFCSEKCRTRQMRRPYRTYTARPWMS